MGQFILWEKRMFRRSGANHVDEGDCSMAEAMDEVRRDHVADVLSRNLLDDALPPAARELGLCIHDVRELANPSGIGFRLEVTVRGLTGNEAEVKSKLVHADDGPVDPQSIGSFLAETRIKLLKLNPALADLATATPKAVSAPAA